MTWCNNEKIYNLFYDSSFPILSILSIHYTFSTFKLDISYIVYNLGVLGVTQKIQVIGSLKVDELFTTSLWI